MTSLMALYVCLYHDVILHKNFKTWPNGYVLDPILFNLIRWIELCVKKNLTFVDCEIKFIKLILKTVINPYLNKLWFLRVCSTSLLKTL